MNNRSRQELVIEYDPLGDPRQSLASPTLPCGACGAPRPIGSRFCVACGIPFETPNEFATAARHTSDATYREASSTFAETGQTIETVGTACTFRCESCGSEVDVVKDERSLRCPFCDSHDFCFLCLNPWQGGADCGNEECLFKTNFL